MEREMSSFTYRSAIDISETDVTWRFQSKTHRDIEDNLLSMQLGRILNPDLNQHQQEKNMLIVLERLKHCEREHSFEGKSLQHTMDEIVWVMVDHLLAKHCKPERALKKLQKRFATGSDILAFINDNDFNIIFDPDEPHFNLKDFIGSEHGPYFWMTIQRLVAKYLENEIAIKRAAILQLLSVWPRSVTVAARNKIKELFPDATGTMNVHHSENKGAEEWYKEFVSIEDPTYRSSKRKSQYLKGGERVCGGCGHSLNCITMRKSELKVVEIYCGGWPTEEVMVFHDELCVV